MEPKHRYGWTGWQLQFDYYEVEDRSSVSDNVDLMMMMISELMSRYIDSKIIDVPCAIGRETSPVSILER